MQQKPDKMTMRGKYRTLQTYYLWFESLGATDDALLIQRIDTFKGARHRVLVPESLKQEVVELCHHQDAAAHFGIDATVSRMLKTLNFPGFQTDVRRIAACHHCPQKVTRELIKQGMYIPIRSVYPLQTLSVDFISGLNICADGTKYMLNVQDRWSRFCQLYPL